MNEVKQVNVDWAEIKKVLNSILLMVEDVVKILPSGLPKTILTGIAAAIQFIISILPAS